MPEFLIYMGNVFTPFNFMVLLLGTAGGLILGALPGLSPTMAVALLIPFTFHMEPSAGLILLGSVYTSTVAGGAVSAILLNIPGAPANIATALDGSIMAQQGRATEALQLSFLASGVGGIAGILVLIFFTPVLAEWALAFGPSHLFWLAMLGVTVIASLSSGSVIKGLAAGCIGLWISSIGYDGVQGVDRFAFSEHLIGGIHIIPALVGLFAIPQVLDMLARWSSGRVPQKLFYHSLRQALHKIASKPRVLGIGSVVGVIIGLIPGAGGQIAGLVAYDQARKFSNTRHTYGKGEAEGLIAAESANNAMVGPSLVPLLILSVPGSPTAAVLLGGLLIHGIFPGPELFNKYPEVVWTFIDALLVGQVLMVILGLALCRVAARVILLPEHYLAAGVVVLAVFGTYSVQNSYSDVLIMATLGTAMWVLSKYGFSSGPLVLGIVLGPIAEENFVYGYTIATAGGGDPLPYFFGGAINIALMALIAVSIVSSAVLEIRARAQNPTRPQHPKHSTHPKHPRGNAALIKPILRLPASLGGDLLVLALALVAAYAGFTADEPSAYVFPRLTAILMVVFCGINIIRLALKGFANAPPALTLQLLQKVAPGAVVIWIYVLLAEDVGFYASAWLAFFLIAFLYSSPRRLLSTLAISSIVAAILYLMFSVSLQVHAPAGVLL